MASQIPSTSGDATPGGALVPGALLPVAGALARLAGALEPVTPRLVPLSEAVGLVLAEDLAAPAPVPPRSLALRAGWALAAVETVGASAYAPAPLAAPPARVAPGDPLPPGADAVLPPDAVDLTSGFPEAVGAASPGEGVRRAGEDLAAGVVLRGVGRRLRALDAAAGLAAGLPRALVRRPVLAVAAPEGDPAALLVAAIGHARGAAVLRAPPGELGDGDVVMALGDPAPVATRLAREGSLVAAGLALRPGETGACGLMGGRPVIAAPARIEAAFALFVALVGPCLDRLSGAPPEEPSFEGPLTRKVSSTVGLTEIALVRVTKGGLEPLGVADLTLQALLRAQGWFAVPPEEEGAPAGEPARAYPMPGRPDPQDPEDP